MTDINVWISFLGFTVLLYRLKPWVDWHPAPISNSIFKHDNSFQEFINEAPLVSIIVPCRNEEDNIGILLESLERLQYPKFEVLVVDDSSEDSTVSLVKHYPEVKLLHAGVKPEIWTGKNWPCHVGAMKAKGEILLFTDADTIHSPGSLQLAVSHLKSTESDMISAPSFHECRFWWEKALGFFNLLPLLITNFRGKPSSKRVYAIGQYLMFKKDVYWQMGGHKAISSSLVDDIDLAMLCLERRFSYSVFPVAKIYSVQMFSSFKSFINGWTRLLRLGMKRVNFVVFLEIFFIFHAVLSVFNPQTYIIGLASWALLYFSQSRFGAVNFIGIILLPVNILLFTFITLKALGEKIMKQKITWRNRTYLSIIPFFSTVLLTGILFMSSSSFAGELSLQISNLRNGKGAVAISLFSEEHSSSFPGNATNAVKTYYIELNGRTQLVVHLGSLPEGIYAVSLLHDENGNRKLDTKLGIPQEGFGFSNNPKVYFGAPSFDKCKFQLTAQPSQAQIQMKYLL